MSAQNKESIPKISSPTDKPNSILYSFHENIDKVKMLKIPTGFNDSPMRPSIMKILLDGIKDEETKLKRYALNAREIKQELDKNAILIQQLNLRKKKTEITEISYTNLYFHLNKLLEIGAIKTIAFVIEKSHRIAYYGRTSHVILLHTPEKVQWFDEVFEEFGKITQIVLPNVKKEDIEKIKAEYLVLKSERQAKIANWVADREQMIRKEDANLIRIYEALTLFDRINPEYQAILKKFSELLP
ncbi:MAG: hypothetical protein ACXAC8_16840 [Candidatus Hodarchaeales archaeon]|jgi:DNA-binding transcriptional ArsR family regulator